GNSGRAPTGRMPALVAYVATLPNAVLAYVLCENSVVSMDTPGIPGASSASACLTSLATAGTLADGSFWITSTRPGVPCTRASPMSGWWPAGTLALAAEGTQPVTGPPARFSGRP